MSAEARKQAKQIQGHFATGVDSQEKRLVREATQVAKAAGNSDSPDLWLPRQSSTLPSNRDDRAGQV